MTEKTCPAGKKLQTHTWPWNHTDGTPCGEGCKAEEKPDVCSICGVPTEWLPYVGGDDDEHPVHSDDGASWADGGCKRKPRGKKGEDFKSMISDLDKPILQEKPGPVGEDYSITEEEWRSFALQLEDFPIGDPRELRRLIGNYTSGMATHNREIRWLLATIRSLQQEIAGLKNDVAFIHRDGGHHTGRVGNKQSIKDAHQVWGELREKADTADELQKGITAIELYAVETDYKHSMVKCSLCGGEHKHTPTCPLSNLPEAARKRGEYVRGLEEVLEDKQRLARKIDVVMFGEEGAAKQPGLADILKSVEQMKAENTRLERLERTYKAFGKPGSDMPRLFRMARKGLAAEGLVEALTPFSDEYTERSFLVPAMDTIPGHQKYSMTMTYREIRAAKQALAAYRGAIKE